MAKDLTEAEIEAWLERENPFFDQDSMLLGIWPRASAMRLEGLRDRVRWRTRHGPATVAWLFDGPEKVWAAACADGTRCDITWTVDGGFRRPVSGAVRWRYGTIDVGSDDVRFVDGGQSRHVAPSSASDLTLENDLARDRAFTAALQNERFAHATYDVLANHSWLRAGSAGAWIQVSSYDVARLVAALRGMDESVEDFIVDEDKFHQWPGSRHAGYAFKGVWPDDRASRMARLEEQLEKERARLTKQLFFMRGRHRGLVEHYEQELATMRSDDNGDVMRLLHAHLTRLGWRSVTAADVDDATERALDQRVAILHEIRALEARPSANPAALPPRDRRGGIQGPIHAVPSDVLARLSPDRREAYFPISLLHRIQGLVLSGRISDTERQAMEARLHEASQRYHC